LSQIEAEVKAAIKLGLPASFVRETSLPFPVAGAIEFTNQAQFHVRKYLLHLAKLIPDNGSYLFENTRVENVEEGNPCQVITDKGTVRASKVIVIKWDLFDNLEQLRQKLSDVLSQLTPSAIASVTRWDFILDALSVANI
jgi:hypothetical protein